MQKCLEMLDSDDSSMIRTLLDWQELIEFLHHFPLPRSGFDDQGDTARVAWAFRGANDAKFKLEPSIERSANGSSMDWAALEANVSEEFKSRAQMYISQPLIPTDELTWLALMQHYGIPTRLLDFTFSPFVAVYFAARESKHERQSKDEREHVRVWAMDIEAINNRFRNSMAQFESSVGGKSREWKRVKFGPDDFSSQADTLKSETLTMRRLVEEALAATSTLRGEIERGGCVCAVRPPSFNARLANQQGVFLLNCADALTLGVSLEKMMHGAQHWRETFDIPVSLLPDIENRLFQMNIHEQSLFPDLEGLAGLIRQQIRLHWK